MIFSLQTQALALTRPKSELVLSLAADNNASPSNLQHHSSSQHSNSKTAISPRDSVAHINEVKIQNIDHTKNPLINFGSHEKLPYSEHTNDHKHEQQQSQPSLSSQKQQVKSISHQSQSNLSKDSRISPKTNCFHSETTLAADDSKSGNNQPHQHQQHQQPQQQQISGVSDNCPTTTPLAVKLNISAATSPLIENGGGSASSTAYIQEKYLPSSTTSPSDLRKEFDSKVNGELHFLFLIL